MGQMADKRNKQVSLARRRFALVSALGTVMIWGRSIFDDESESEKGGPGPVQQAARGLSRLVAPAQFPVSEGKLYADEMTREYGRALLESILADGTRAEERDALVEQMRDGFPGDGFPFWRRQSSIADKPILERWALLDALRALLERQLRRLRRSQSLVSDPVANFKRLYREGLLACVSESEVHSPWQLRADPDVSGTGRSDEPVSDGGALLDLDMLEAADKRVDARLMRETRFFFLGLFVRALSPGYRDLLFAPVTAADLDEPLLARGKAELLRICAHYDFESCRAELMEALCAKDDRSTGVTEGESRAIGAAMRAILRGGSPFSHSRRGDSLVHYLTPTQMRQLRSACAKDGAVRPFLLQFSSWLKKRREKYLSLSGVPSERPKRARGRIGVLTKNLKDAERTGVPGSDRIVQGVRAIMKGERGDLLTDDEFDLAKEASMWWQQTVLRPSQRTRPARVGWMSASAEDLEGPAGAQRLGDALLLALSYWPEGARALGAQLPTDDTNRGDSLPFRVVTVPRDHPH